MKFHLLFDREGPRIGPDDGYETAPVLDALEAVVARLRAAQQRLRAVAFDDLLGLCDAAARSWTQPGHPLADFIRRNRLGFLPLWLRRANLQTLAQRSLRGRPEALDRFVPLGEKDATAGPRPAAGTGRALGCRQRAGAGPAVAGAGHALQECQRGEGLPQPAGHLAASARRAVRGRLYTTPGARRSAAAY